jgi:hypothetical protein
MTGVGLIEKMYFLTHCRELPFCRNIHFNMNFWTSQQSSEWSLQHAFLAILINLRQQEIAADISKFGGNFFVTINWHFDREQNYFIFSILLTLLIKSVWYSRKPCFTHNNWITLRPAINLLVLTLLHYGRCSEVTRSISELSMYFKISHKNKSVHKRIAHFPRLIF